MAKEKTSLNQETVQEATVEAPDNRMFVLHTKAELIVSQTFKDRQDLLNAVMKDGEKLSVSDAECRINDYLRKKV